MSQLVGEEADDLRRPQELVLEVDEALGAARSRARSSRGCGSRRRGTRVVHVLGDRPHDLHRVLAGGAAGRRAVQLLAGHLAPAQREVVVDVGDRGAAQARADVVPAEAPPGRVVARVEPVAGVVGHVDPADERELAVDDHASSRDGSGTDARADRSRSGSGSRG